MSQNPKRPFASLAEAERLIRAGRALLTWAGDGDRQGNYAEAERCFRKALTILRDAVVTGHPQLALAWDRLGVLYEELEDPEEAESCYLRSLATQQAAGWASVCDGLTIRRLARLYGRTGRQRLESFILTTCESRSVPRSRRGRVDIMKRPAARARQRERANAGQDETRPSSPPPLPPE